jgi:hypothetical protein
VCDERRLAGCAYELRERVHSWIDFDDGFNSKPAQVERHF